MNKITTDMRDKLRAPLPAEAITTHPTKTYLSSIKAIYVTERLNEVFGVGVWQLRTDQIERAEGGTVVVKTTLTIPEYGVHYESFGGNDNGGEKSKNFDLGDAYKGATTDSITKICSYMEIGIDVYKGKSKPAKTEKPVDKPTESKKDWLNPGTPNWNYAVKRIKEGVNIEDILKTFNISKANKTKLENEAKN